MNLVKILSQIVGDEVKRNEFIQKSGNPKRVWAYRYTKMVECSTLCEKNANIDSMVQLEERLETPLYIVYPHKMRRAYSLLGL